MIFARIAIAIVLCVSLYLILDYLAVFERRVEPDQTPTTGVSGYRLEEVARGLQVPWDIVWTSDERMLVSERPGRIRVIENGALREEPLHTFDEVSSRAEEGLMGLAISPAYPSDRFIYASLAYAADDELAVKVVRFRDEGDRLSGETVIIDRIPGARYHAGSRIGFGPDGMLYVTTGDSTEPALAQDMDSLAGKTLRVMPDGSIPRDNPFPGSPVWSYGHRNAQGLTWHPETGVMYQSEHGPSVVDGPAGGDEVNRVVRGGNFGWPLVSHEEIREGTIAPLAIFTPAEAPGSLLVYSGRAFRQFAGDLFFGALRGEGIIRIMLSEDGTETESIEKMAGIDLGRIRALVEGPDGFIYFSTSNRDGRGDPIPEDDRIMRIVPEAE